MLKLRKYFCVYKRCGTFGPFDNCAERTDQFLGGASGKRGSFLQNMIPRLTAKGTRAASTDLRDLTKWPAYWDRGQPPD
jgi:hypothetical protein